MPIPSLTSEGFLPLGRYAATADETHDRYVTPYPAANPRHKIWGDWLTVTDLLHQAVGSVSAAWLGGSFLSDKDEPDDIDCLYVVPAANLAAVAGKPEAKVLQLLTDHGPTGLQQTYGLRVDSYLLPWPLNPHNGPQTSDDYAYVQSRGYWDDFWQRRRSGGKMDTPKPEDGLPRRGYVEVILDGYTV